ncbi:MAG: hypothetical protein RL497_355 [Pseudomonadota bacterium]
MSIKVVKNKIRSPGAVALATTLTLVLCLFQLGCTAQYSRELSRDTLAAVHLSDHYELKRQHTWVLPHSSKLYLGYPDVSLLDEDQPITRTQFQLAQKIKQKFTQQFPGCMSQMEADSLTQTFKAAQQLNAEFLLLPQLMAISENPYAEGQKEHSKGYWQLNFRIYDVRSKKLLDTLKMDGKQGVLNWRKQEPVQLVEAGITQAAQALAGE